MRRTAWLAGVAGWALLSGSALAAAPADVPADATSAGRAWLDGDAEAALSALARLPASRERDFNRAMLALYRGDAAAAEGLFRDLQARDPAWTPAVRGLARAQKALTRPEAADTAMRVLTMAGATGRDHFFAARLLAERHDLERARDGFRRAVAAEDDLYLGWVALAEVEEALGHEEAARAARAKTEALYPAALSVAPAPPPAMPTPLRYKARYLFITLATLTISDRASVEVQGRSAWLRTLEAKSTGLNVFFRINSRYESAISADGTLLSHRNLTNDSSSTRHHSAVDIDPATGAFRARQVRDGLFLYDVLALPPRARPHDGLSMIEAARTVARTRRALSILRIVDSTWKGSVIRPVRAERIGWQGQKVETELVEVGITSRSAAGTVGALQLWISADERAIPYRTRMGIAVGSVVLELMP